VSVKRLFLLVLVAAAGFAVARRAQQSRADADLWREVTREDAG
jgi:hypothetical protein